MGFSDLTGGFSMLDGVASLNGQVGFVDITSTGGTVVITKPTASTINLESLGGGGSPLTTKGDIYTYSTTNDRLPVGTNGQVLSADSTAATGIKWVTASGTGTVTSVSVTTANGVSGSVATATTTPAITLTLGAITPSAISSARITKRVVTTTQSATPTINTDNTDRATITGLAQAITSFTTNLTGTPVAGDLLAIDITDNGTARAITWGASFEASGNVPLPTTTVTSTRLDVGFVWNPASSKWRCVAIA